MPRTFFSIWSRLFRLLLAALSIGLSGSIGANAQSLESFAILGGSTITNTGISTVNGNIGLSPGTATTGTGLVGANSIVLTGGTLHINDGLAQTAKSDLTTAFNILMGRQTTVDLTGQTLGVGPAATLGAGVYNFDTSAQLNGILTLTGNASDIFVFKIGSTLTTASASAIVLGGTVQAGNVFFVVGSSATLGTTTAFKGQILALTSITLNNAATINCGAAWARNGAVTLDTNTINVCTFQIAPGTIGTTLPDTATTNQGSVAAAIDQFVAGGGSLPLAFGVLALLTPEELALALSELSGESATGVTLVGSRAMDSFLDAVLGQPGGSERTIVSREGAPADNTVSVMGYADSARMDEGPALASVTAATSGPMPDIAAWTIWGELYGGQGNVAGSLTTGTHAVSTQDFGYAIGFERHVSSDTLFGLAISSGGTNFNLADSLGSGHSAMLQAALYSRTTIRDIYLATVLAYGLHDVTTDRNLDIGGAAHYRAKFVGQDFAGAVEVGYDAGWITPYVAGRLQAYLTPGYSETTVSGSDIFALTHRGSVALSARTEIGVKFNASHDFEGGQLRAQASIAWAHTFRGANTIQASFQALPGSSFVVAGATPAADLVLLSTGAGAQFDNGMSLGASLGAELARNAQTYKASVRIGYTF